MNEERRREIGLFRYALVRDAADPALSKASAAGWSARWPSGSMSGPTAGWWGRRTTLDGWSARTVVAGLRRCSPAGVVPPRTPAGCWSWRSR